MDLLCHSRKNIRFSFLEFFSRFTKSNPFRFIIPNWLIVLFNFSKKIQLWQNQVINQMSLIIVTFSFSGCHWSTEILAKNPLTERSYVPEWAWRNFRCYRTFRIFKNYDTLIQSTCQMRLFATLPGLPKAKISADITILYLLGGRKSAVLLE